MPRTARGSRSSAPRRRRRSQRPPGLALEGAAFLVTVVAIALWAEPLAAALGVDAVERRAADRAAAHARAAVGAARPPPGPPVGPHRPGRRGGALARAALAIVGGAGARCSAGRGCSPGCSRVTWTGGSILIRRGWARGLLRPSVRGAVPMLLAGAPALAVVAAVAAVTALGVAWALRDHAPAGRRAPGPLEPDARRGPDRRRRGLLLVGRPDRQLGRRRGRRARAAAVGGRRAVGRAAPVEARGAFPQRAGRRPRLRGAAAPGAARRAPCP